MKQLEFDKTADTIAILSHLVAVPEGHKFIFNRAVAEDRMVFSKEEDGPSMSAFVRRESPQDGSHGESCSCR